MSTIQDQLALFTDDIVMAIDPGRCLWKIIKPEDPELSWAWRGYSFSNVPPRVALDIRLGQARRWLEVWCKKQDVWFSEGFHPDKDRSSTLYVANGTHNRASLEIRAGSPAEALVSAIKTLLEGEKVNDGE